MPFLLPPFSGEQMNVLEKLKCCMFFYDNKILNPITVRTK